MAIAILLGLRFNRRSAWALLALSAVQFPLTSTPQAALEPRGATEDQTWNTKKSRGTSTACRV
ncbi:hypothetical protein [Cellulomonas pakistanensis]|uniref:hypothetical protein n=1 Tax=Cellulomonas pakistanensis TaxID=992287 RepID=UPI000AFADAFF|nr:hypothetical protein [Cellulomonas pakistanensis]